GNGSIEFDYDTSISGSNFTSTATINVTGLNDAPVANNDSGIVDGGLRSQYWVYNQGADGPNLETVAQVLTFTSNTPHDATFVSTGLNYSVGSGDLGTGNNLENWIGDDADTLDYPVQQSAGDAILRFTGGFHVGESGTFDFEIIHDDGFIVFIDGQAAFTADFIDRKS